MATITIVGRYEPVNIWQRLRRVFALGDCDPDTAEPESVSTTLVEIERHRVAKKVLSDKLESTGFLLGDAAMGRIDRRTENDAKGQK